MNCVHGGKVGCQEVICDWVLTIRWLFLIRDWMVHSKHITWYARGGGGKENSSQLRQEMAKEQMRIFIHIDWIMFCMLIKCFLHFIIFCTECVTKAFYIFEQLYRISVDLQRLGCDTSSLTNLHPYLLHTQALHTNRINLSPFTKDFRVWGAPI